MRIALITGASSGLGQAYAHWADKQGSYDELWLVARREERLTALESKLSLHCVVLPLDLSKLEACEILGKRLQAAAQSDANFEIGLLVNAAGLGKFGTYRDLSAAEVSAMIDVNCRALTLVCQSALPYMHAHSRLLNIASSASYLPLPGLNVYAASKAFVRSYTRALRFELRGQKIHATAVCPLWIKTEFIDVARETANGQTVRHPFPQLSIQQVIQASLVANSLNLAVASCGISAIMLRLFAKILPAPMCMWGWELIRRL